MDGRRRRMNGGDLSVLVRRPLSLAVSRGAIAARDRVLRINRQRRTIGFAFFASAPVSSIETTATTDDSRDEEEGVRTRRCPTRRLENSRCRGL